MAITLNGTTQYIDHGVDTPIRITGARTVVAMINGTHGAAALHAVAAKYLGPQPLDFYLAIFQQKVRGLVGKGTAFKGLQGTTSLSDNTWYTIGMSWSGVSTENVRLWLDGADDGGTSFGNPTFSEAEASTKSLEVGSRENGGSLYDGTIAYVAIIARELTAGEHLTIYHSRGYAIQSMGPVFHSRYDERPSGTTASGSGSLIDISTTALHGTAQNSPTYAPAPIRIGRGNVAQ